MKSSEQQSRINLSELKAQIVKKLGLERSKQYFYYLNRLLSEKLSKGEFDKLSLQILGRENLPLHNQFIRSILKNACQSKVPPPAHIKEVPGKPTAVLPLPGKKHEDGHNHLSVSRSSLMPMPALGVPTPPIWSNGDMLPMSPRKGRSGIRDRRIKDRPSPLGPNGKTDTNAHQLNAIANDGSMRVNFTENGDLKSCDFQRPLQHHQGHAQLPENEHDVSLHRSTTRPQIKNSFIDPVSVHSNGPVGAVERSGGMELDGNFVSSRSPLRAPLGIPFCSASLGGSRRISSAPNRSSFISSVDRSELIDTVTLNKRMEQIAGSQGLEGVSMSCANLLNKGLDLYLKQLIKSCIQLAGTRSEQEKLKQPVYKQQPQGKPLNGIRPGHQLQMQSRSGAMESMQEARTCSLIDLLDFKVAMELNPQQLGEDWPLLMEKITMHGCEE